MKLDLLRMSRLSKVVSVVSRKKKSRQQISRIRVRKLFIDVDETSWTVGIPKKFVEVD